MREVVVVPDQQQYRLYIDDSGEKEYAANSRYFVYAGVVLALADEAACNAEIGRLKTTVFGRPDVELKSNWLRIKRERERRYLNPFGISAAQLDGMVEELYCWMARCPLLYVAAAIDKIQMKERYADALSLGRLVLGVDVARSGADRSVVCVARGPMITDFHWWRGADLEVTSGRVIEVMRSLGIRQLQPRNYEAEAALLATPVGAALLAAPAGAPDDFMEHARDAVARIDTVGLGAGCYDRLNHQHWPVEAFNAASKPVGGERQEARFANRRAQSFFALRKLLEGDDIALPAAWRDELVRELTAIAWTVTGSGKVIIESKADVRSRLGGQSPDFADALAFAVAPDAGARFGPATGPIAF